MGSFLRLRRVASTNNRYTSHLSRAALILAWIAAVGATILLNRSGSAFQSSLGLVGAGAAIGGAAGNLTDILKSRFVVDFIDLGWWPVFNLADVAIIGGLAVAFIAG